MCIFLEYIVNHLKQLIFSQYLSNIRKIMKGKKIMQKETKKERFDRISEARKIKILDGIRLLENCSNKSNYEYTNDEIENIFADIEKALHSAKA